MAEQAVNVIYKLAENPDLICEDILKKVTRIVMTYTTEPEEMNERQEEPAVGDVEKRPEKDNGEKSEEAEKGVENGEEQSTQLESSQSQGKMLVSLSCY